MKKKIIKMPSNEAWAFYHAIKYVVEHYQQVNVIESVIMIEKTTNWLKQLTIVTVTNKFCFTISDIVIAREIMLFVPKENINGNVGFLSLLARLDQEYHNILTQINVSETIIKPSKANTYELTN